MILLTCHLSPIYFAVTADQIAKESGVNDDYSMNDFLNREMCSTFEFEVALPVIHDRLGGIHHCRFL